MSRSYDTRHEFRARDKGNLPRWRKRRVTSAREARLMSLEEWQAKYGPLPNDRQDHNGQ